MRFSVPRLASQHYLNLDASGVKHAVYGELSMGRMKTPMVSNDSISYSPAHYKCSIFRWSSKANAQAMMDRLQSGEFNGLDAADIEYRGVRPIHEMNSCLVDNIEVYPKSKQPSKSSKAQPLAQNKSSDADTFDYMTIVNVRYSPSTHDQMKQQYSNNPIYKNIDVSQSGIENQPARLKFQIPAQEIQRLGIRMPSKSYRQGFWKEGFAPQNIGELQNLKDKSVKLTNVTQRGRDFYFETTIVSKVTLTEKIRATADKLGDIEGVVDNPIRNRAKLKVVGGALHEKCPKIEWNRDIYYDNNGKEKRIKLFQQYASTHVVRLKDVWRNQETGYCVFQNMEVVRQASVEGIKESVP